MHIHATCASRQVAASRSPNAVLLHLSSTYGLFQRERVRLNLCRRSLCPQLVVSAEELLSDHDGLRTSLRTAGGKRILSQIESHSKGQLYAPGKD